MATKPSKAPSGDAIATLAPMMVGTLNLFVIESMGEPCGITDMEAKFLIPSTQRTLERMPKRAAENAAIILDPLIIVAILGMWFRRATQIKRAETLQRYVVGPNETARANGVTGTEYRIPTQAQDADEQAFYDEMRRQDEMRAAGVIVIPPDGEGVPIPEHPDATGGAVPQSIRDSLRDSLNGLNGSL